MGPGYVPRLVSFVLIGLGVLIGAKSVVVPGPAIGRPSWKPLVIVLRAVILFGVAIERLGLAFTIVAVVIVSSLAARDVRWRGTVAFAVVLAVACVLLFTTLLGLPLRVWPF